MSRVKHTERFEIGQPVERLFPLFSAEGETLWVPGWTYENVMGGTDLHEDYVFLTRAHDHSSTDAVWIVKRYEPEEYLVEFYRVEPGDKLGVVSVQCFGQSDTVSKVEVSYEYIALSESGEAFVREFSAEVFDEYIREWKTLLEAYFRRVDG